MTMTTFRVLFLVRTFWVDFGLNNHFGIFNYQKSFYLIPGGLSISREQSQCNTYLLSLWISALSKVRGTRHTHCAILQLTYEPQNYQLTWPLGLAVHHFLLIAKNEQLWAFFSKLAGTPWSEMQVYQNRQVRKHKSFLPLHRRRTSADFRRHLRT